MEINAKTENVVLGTIGAIIGSIIGSVLWIILDQVGFIASIAAVAIIFCGIKGYEIFAKKISKKGLIICIIITLIVIFLADLVSLGISAYIGLKSEYDVSLIRCIFYSYEFLSVPEVASPFWISLGMGYLFAAGGCFKIVGGIWDSLKESEPAGYENFIPNDVTITPTSITKENNVDNSNSIDE